MLDKMLKTFACAKVKISDNFLDYKHYTLVLQNLNWKATPGYPLCLTYPTVADVFKWDGIKYDEARAQEVYLQLMDWIENPTLYPFRVFTKVEPLAPAKAEVGRWRLIFGAPLYLQLLDHLLFDKMNQSLMDNRWNLPTQLGWHPFWGSSEWVLRQFDNPYSLDKSLFDWTVQWWQLEQVKLFRQELVVAPAYWHHLVDFSYEYSYKRAQLIMSDGQVYQQEYDGAMKSGLVNTLSDNSLMQCFLQEHSFIECGCEHHYVTIGDDVLMEKPCEKFFSKLSQYCILKYVQASTNFAGFDLKTKIPEYWSKHINKLIWQDEAFLAETLETYTSLYCFSNEKFKFFSDLLAEIDVTRVKSAR